MEKILTGPNLSNSLKLRQELNGSYKKLWSECCARLIYTQMRLATPSLIYHPLHCYHKKKPGDQPPPPENLLSCPFFGLRQKKSLIFTLGASSFIPKCTKIHYIGFLKALFLIKTTFFLLKNVPGEGREWH